MFYTHVLMSKRGPLAKIWLAAHWEKKLTKAHVFECNIEMTIQNIISPKVKIALRTSGHLLLGVVRIYNRKAKYLLADCTEAFLKMKMTFRPGLVDLPKENFEAAYNAITLPEEFHDFDNCNMNVIDASEYFTYNQSRPEEITLREDFGNDLLFQAESSGEEPELLRRHTFFDDNILLNSSGPLIEHSSESLHGEGSLFYDNGDGFGDEGAAGEMIGENSTYAVETLQFTPYSSLNRHEDVSGALVGIVWYDSIHSLKYMLCLQNQGCREVTKCNTDNLLQDDENVLLEDMHLNNETPMLPATSSSLIELNNPDDQHLPEDKKMDETSLSNEEGFTLDPIDVLDLVEKRKSKKRKLLIDPVKEISSKTMYKQLISFADTLMTLDLAPPTRRLMMWKKKGGVDILLSTATENLIHAELKMLFEKCFLPCGFKLSRRLMQKEPVRDEGREQDTVETSMMEEPDFHKQLGQPQIFMDVIEGSFHEDVNKNVYSEQDIIEMVSEAAEKSSSMNASLAQENCPVDLESSDSEQTVEADRWNRRLFQMLNRLRDSNKRGMQSFSLKELCRNSDRKQTAAKFYTFLVLKKQQAIELHQSAPYADIIATVGPMFYKM